MERDPRLQPPPHVLTTHINLCDSIQFKLLNTYHHSHKIKIETVKKQKSYEEESKNSATPEVVVGDDAARRA